MTVQAQTTPRRSAASFDAGPPAPPETMVEFKALIQRWYADNHDGFADALNAAIENVQPIPQDILEEDRKRVEDARICFDWTTAKQDPAKTLCAFFDGWYGWNPDLTLDNGLARIQQFSWLYYKNEAGREFVMNDPGRLMTYFFVYIKGKWMDSAESKKLVDIWLEEMGSAIDDYIVPGGGYQSYNKFFTRELKYGKRPISGVNDDAVVVSPADAIVNMIDDELSIDKPLDVKTQKLSVRQLLNESPLAENFEGGTAVSCILMPTVYHRYHSPVEGKVVDADEDVAGIYFGISDFPKLINGGNVGYGYDYSVFEHFRRGYMIIETQKYGHVAMIPVGLNTVGSVVFREKFKKVTPDAPVQICKGEEVGYFQYGGSLNILLFEKGCFPAVRIPQGQIIGTLNEKTRPTVQYVF